MKYTEATRKEDFSKLIISLKGWYKKVNNNVKNLTLDDMGELLSFRMNMEDVLYGNSSTFFSNKITQEIIDKYEFVKEKVIKECFRRAYPNS